MLSINELTEFLGWCVVINVACLIAASLAMSIGKNKIIAMHSRMFDIEAPQLRIIYMKYLAQYKLLSLVFFFTPYLALKIMG